MSYNDTGFKTFLTAGAITQGARVKLSAENTIVVAGAGEQSIGVALEACASGGYCTVKMYTAPGTFMVQTDAAIAVNSEVYGAASGQVSSSASGAKIFKILKASSGAGGLVEAQYLRPEA